MQISAPTAATAAPSSPALALVQKYGDIFSRLGATKVEVQAPDKVRLEYGASTASGIEAIQSQRVNEALLKDTLDGVQLLKELPPDQKSGWVLPPDAYLNNDTVSKQIEAAHLPGVVSVVANRSDYYGNSVVVRSPDADVVTGLKNLFNPKIGAIDIAVVHNL